MTPARKPDDDMVSMGVNLPRATYEALEVMASRNYRAKGKEIVALIDAAARAAGLLPDEK